MSLVDNEHWRVAFLANNPDAWTTGATSGYFHCQICAIISCLIKDNNSLHNTNTCEHCTFLCKCERSIQPVLSHINSDYGRVNNDQKGVYDIFINWYNQRHIVENFIDMIDAIDPAEMIDVIDMLIGYIPNVPLKPFDWTGVMVDYDIREGELVMCSICQDECKGTVSKTSCNHIFHKECILKWGDKGKSTCPVCREEFKK